MIAQYEADMARALDGLRAETLDAAVALAESPQQVRGFGPVKEASRREAQAKREGLLARLRPDPRPAAAE